MAEFPKTLNDYPVVAAAELPRRAGCLDACLIMVDRGDGSFVVSTHTFGTKCWNQGHYFDPPWDPTEEQIKATRAEAYAYFCEEVMRYAKRFAREARQALESPRHQSPRH